MPCFVVLPFCLLYEKGWGLWEHLSVGNHKVAYHAYRATSVRFSDLKEREIGEDVDPRAFLGSSLGDAPLGTVDTHLLPVGRTPSLGVG